MITPVFRLMPGWTRPFGLAHDHGASIHAARNSVRAFEFAGGEGLIRLQPQWYQAALRIRAPGI